MSTTATTTVELESRLPTPKLDSSEGSILGGRKDGGSILGSKETVFEEPKRETWRNPAGNKYRFFATLWYFLLMGMNDAAPGPLIPYLTEDYDLKYSVVALIFLAPVVGCFFSAFMNNTLHRYWGRRGVTMMAGIAHTIAYTIMCTRPPYPVIVVAMCIAGIGTGSIDAAYNAYVGNLDRSNELMGIMHGMYGVGAVLSPIIATSMVTNGIPWQRFYLIMVGIAVSCAIGCTWAFWPEDGFKYRRDHPTTDGEGEGGHGRTRKALMTNLTWIIAGFLMLYVGAEVSLGGWIVTFMIDVRKGEKFDSGMVSSGFWIGLTAGRFLLAWPTGKLGVRKAATGYLACSIVMELLFWLIPQFHVSAVAVAFLGFFLGPLFPSCMVIATDILPARLHVTVIGFTAGIGAGLGATVFPYIVGAIAQSKGVAMMNPLVTALLAAQFVLFVLLTRIRRKED